METARILLSFIIPLAVMLFMIQRKVTPTFFLLIGAILSGLISGLPLTTIVSEISNGFGSIVTMCGLVVIFGVIFSEYLSASGAMEHLAQRISKTSNAQGSIYIIYIMGYIISIPVNFTPAAALMMPLLKRLSATLKKPIQSYACAFSVASFSTNCLVIPTMTPVMLASMAGITGNRLGWMIVFGLLISFAISAVAALGGALILAKKYGSIQRATDAATEQETAATGSQAPIAITLLMILLPILLMVIGTFLPGVFPETSFEYQFFSFIGDPTIALFLSILTEMVVLRPYLRIPAMQVFENGLRTSGSYLIVLGAANAFGTVLSAGGIGDCLMSLLSGSGMPLLLLAWLLTTLLRAGTGVMTVAATATLSVLLPVIQASNVSPILFVLAICVACIGLIIPTDPAFWLYKEGYGLSVKDTFISITLPGTVASIIGIVLIMVLDLLMPGLSVLA